jgi:hypothetical protein
MSETATKTATETDEEMQARVSAKLMAAREAAKEPAEPMSAAQAKDLIRNAMAKAEAEGRPAMEAVREVPPVAFTARLKEGVNLGDEASFLSPVVEITPVINPLFHALMIVAGATLDGARTYRISAGEKADPRFLEAALEVLPGGICYTPEHVDKGEKLGFHDYNSKRYKVYADLYWKLRAVPAGEKVKTASTEHMRSTHPTEGPLAGAAVVINNNGKQMYFKVCTTRQEGRGGLYFTDDELSPCMDRFRPGGRLEPQSVTPDQAITILEEAAAQGYQIIDPTGDLKLIRSVLAEIVVAQRVPGAPGEARLVVGSKVDVSKIKTVEAALPSSDPSRSTRTAIVPARVAGAAISGAAKGGAATTILDPMVQDVMNMAEAKPVDDPRLRPYQREAVGLHLATTTGFLQAASPGLGKTVMTLEGMRLLAERALAARAS